MPAPVFKTLRVVHQSKATELVSYPIGSKDSLSPRQSLRKNLSLDNDDASDVSYVTKSSVA